MFNLKRLISQRKNKMPKKLTQEEFIARASSLHKNKYNYSKVIYVNNSTKVEIICPFHGSFFQAPGPHLSGSGCPHPDCVNAKVKNTKLIKYGDPNYRNDAKIRKTNLEKYGCENPFSNQIVKEKIRKTILEKYGVEHPAQNNDIYNKMEKTTLERYGVKNAFESEDIKKKIKKANLEKYGYEYATQSPVQKEKVRNTNLKKYGTSAPAASQSVKDRIKQTWLSKYGVEHPFLVEDVYQKVIATKRKNKTFSSSSPEEEAFSLLKSIFPSVLRNYDSDPRYPFLCDFYVPEKDLFIELNLHWTHGGHWFDSDSKDDIKKLAKWKTKNKDYYDSAISVWTERDLLKRETASKNNLNYAVFWKFDDFLSWIQESCPIKSSPGIS